MIHNKYESPNEPGGDKWLIARSVYRFPEVLEGLPIRGKIISEETVASEECSWELPMRNSLVNYHMTVTEDLEYMRFETEIARVAPAEPLLYGRLHDINSATVEGKIIVERAVEVSGQQESGDAIFFSKQIRKAGVPSATIMEEISAFDAGVSQVFKDVASAVVETGARIIFPHVAPPTVGAKQPTVIETYQSFDRP